MDFPQLINNLETKEILYRIKNSTSLGLIFFGEKDSKSLNNLLAKRIILVDDIEQSIEEAIISEAKRDYEWIIQHNREPDHIGPEYLAYAINKGVFTKKQLERIHFDFEKTPEEFVKRHNKKNLLFDLRDKLLNPEEKENYPLPSEHPICECEI